MNPSVVPPGPQFHAFWAINAPLEPSRWRRQLAQFRAHGFDGVVWHPRFYPGDPPYLSEHYLAALSEVILCAKSLGLTFWLYDEDGWPSGTVGGQLLKQHPADAQRFADLVRERPEACLAEFEEAGQKWFLAGRVGRGVDYFNRDFTRHFIGLTHERYRTGLRPEAWEHVEAIFSDEPEFGLGHAYDSLSPHGALPWTPRLPELFQARYGEDLRPLIPRLFFPGAGAETARVQFWELLTDLFNDAYTTPLNDWCRAHGKLFTAHVKGEEHPLFQVPTNGSCHQFFRRLDLPAIDALERDPGNHFHPRQLSAAARQFGTGRCMAEAFGGAGWGATPEDLERYLLWLGGHGVTDFVLHLSQYRLDSAAMRDWPPSQPLHLTWRAVYPEVLQRVRRQLTDQPRPPADTLVVVPTRGIMARYSPAEWLQTNVHNAATYPDTAAGQINRRFMDQIATLHRAGVNYDVADERTVEEFGRLTAGRLVIGHCEYRRVWVADGCLLLPPAQSLVEAVTAEPSVPEAAPAPRETKSAGSETGVPMAVHWQLEAHPVNTLLLEVLPAPDGSWHAQFEMSVPTWDGPLQLIFADDLVALSVNGQEQTLSASEEGSIAMVSATDLRGVNQVCFRTLKAMEHPFAWLKGIFRVRSRTPFVPGPNQTIKTEGGFVIEPPRLTLASNLIADGFPFLQTAVMAGTEIQLGRAASALWMEGAEADAVRLWVDGVDAGWNWRSAGKWRFEIKLPAGRHQLRAEWLPSTFNGFGPHHYYQGDGHVISPDQFRGVRNFADPVGAPACTHVMAWHFRRLQLPPRIWGLR